MASIKIGDRIVATVGGLYFSPILNLPVLLIYNYYILSGSNTSGATSNTLFIGITVECILFIGSHAGLNRASGESLWLTLLLNRTALAAIFELMISICLNISISSLMLLILWGSTVSLIGMFICLINTA